MIPPRGARAYATGPVVIGSPAVRRPVGGFRGGLGGFFLGFGLASAYGYYYLLQEYNAASRLMLTSVEELQSSTNKITSHLGKVEKLDADFKQLSSSTSTKADSAKNQGDMLKAYDGLHEELLAVKNRLWGVEKDVNNALKKVGARGVVSAADRQV